jgi:hypothetical protein
METPNDDKMDSGRVGYRDIYRAVGESEARIKEHITLVMLPITAAVADHESRIRKIEELGSQEARDALAAATALELRVEAVEHFVSNTADRRTGAMLILGAQRSFVILIGVLLTIVIGVADLSARLATGH